MPSNFALQYESVSRPVQEYLREFLDKSIKPFRDEKKFAVGTIPYTPPALIEEIFEKVPLIEQRCYHAKIAVIYTIEMAMYLSGLGFDNITLITREYDDAMARNALVFGYSYMLENEVKDKNMKFDCVVGNPPYQDDKAQSTSNSSLWVDFSLLALNLVELGGYVSFVTPQSWMKPNHKVFNKFKTAALLNVSTQIKEHFPGVGSTFCYWITRNTNGDVSSNVDGCIIKLRSLPYLVNGSLLPLHEKLVFNTVVKFKIDSDQQTAYTLKLTKGSPDLSKTKNERCVYPIFHTNAQTLYSAIKTKNFDDKKVMFSDSGYFRPKYDDGHLGSSQRCYYVLVDDEIQGRNLVNVFSRKVYQFIVQTAKWSGFSDLTVLRSLPAVDLTRSWTDAELYAHFNLTQEEIDLIEATVK